MTACENTGKAFYNESRRRTDVSTLFNRWQRRAINYFIAVMRSWSPEERQAVFARLEREFHEEVHIAPRPSRECTYRNEP